MRSLQRLRDFKSLVSTGIREACTSLPVLGHPSCGSPERGGGTSGVLGSTSYSTTAAQQQHLFSIDAASSFSQQQRTLSSSSCTLQQQQQQQQQAVSEAVSSTTTLTTSTTVEEDVSSEAPRSPVSLRERLNLMPTAATAAGAKEVSMKAQVIFETSWKRIEQKYKDSIVCPREVVLLNGAPGTFYFFFLKTVFNQNLHVFIHLLSSLSIIYFPCFRVWQRHQYPIHLKNSRHEQSGGDVPTFRVFG